MSIEPVARLEAFYQQHFGLEVVEEIENEWAVLTAGAMELALHRVGAGWRDAAATGSSNAKLVFAVPSGLEALHDRLVAAGVPMRGLKRYDGFAQLMCDGEDPEGNAFQLAQQD
ncbi:VOC family protein [Paraburkholderia sp.]|uniref:VOC family protein n=1 Tax=Paraburkholderia sp. TaxID=1926495 RepID=UPI003D6E6E32